ncbi:MFS transporter [Actinotignum schaalii]|uniref:Sialate:H+ symporter (SHS) family MFS transporter n=1 Tax=Actinotignum schaalii FB123-CNA-2 TaxID=883067 RepID=S2VLL2_9ACTO|nr:MFS transporter [Actinotignum schaalii]EPD26945.1 sialate:H+ symporter (SHS) family MFS transporter [Actinotignum schaalii FB123-CNA-2]
MSEPHSQTTSRPKRWYQYLSREDWKAFFAAWLGVLLDGYDFVLIAFALPAIKETFDLTLVQSASLISAAFISRWLGGLVLGAIGDRYGRKPAMILSIFMFAFGSIACALAPNFWILFVLRLIIGFAMAGEYSASAAYVIESWPRHMRNKASGFLLSGYAFGVIAAAQVDKYFVTWVDSIHPGWGWRALFLTGVVPIAIAIYMRKTLPEANDWEEAKNKGHVEKNDMLSVLFGGKLKFVNYAAVIIASVALLLIFTQSVSGGVVITALGLVCAVIFIYFIIQFDPNRWVIGIAIMVTIFASFMYTWPIQGLLPTYLQGVGMDQQLVANVVSFAGLGNACGYIIAGFAGDRFGMRRWYVISLLLSQAIVFPLFMQGGEYVVLVAALLFFQQMFGQGISGLLPKWVSSYFPVDKRAAGLGFSYNVGALGGAVGPVLGAAVAAKVSLGMALAILSVGFAAIVMISIGANIPRRLQELVNADAVRPEDGDDEIILEGK